MEAIANSRSFVVKQKKELAEIILNWESKNKYEIYDDTGRIIFLAKEDTDCCQRYWCKAARAYHIVFLLPDEQPFLDMQADCACFGQTTVIACPPGSAFGTVVVPFALCRPTFELKDASGQTLFQIPSPWGAACCKCCADVEIPVLNLRGEEVAKITKQWQGILKESFTDADAFALTFTDGVDLEPAHKTLILAAVFPVDFTFFETATQQNTNND